MASPADDREWKTWQCQVCGWIYDEAKGDPKAGLPPFTRWRDVPSDWTCPDCMAAKAEFVMVEITERVRTDATAAAAPSSEPVSDLPIVVIGAGLAGYNLVREYRKAGGRGPIEIVTADDGDYFVKPALSSAFAHRQTPADLVGATASQMAERLGVAVRNHTCVEKIDLARREIVTSDRIRTRFRDLVLAVGAREARLAVDGSARDAIQHINDLADYGRLRKSLEGKREVLVIGGGLVGVELAHDFLTAGLRVTLTDLADRPLAALLPPVASAALERGLQAVGLISVWERRVQRIDRDGARLLVRWDDGRELHVDCVVAAIGRGPMTGLAKAAGLSTARGIKVDRFLRTGHERVYAIGDCAEIDGLCQPFVLPLMASCRALAATLCGQPAEVEFGALPITLKTPTIPVVIYLRHGSDTGIWKCEEFDGGVRATLHSPIGGMIGFALVGEAVGEREQLLEKMPPLLPPAYVLPRGNETPELLLRPARDWRERVRAWWLGG